MRDGELGVGEEEEEEQGVVAEEEDREVADWTVGWARSQRSPSPEAAGAVWVGQRGLGEVRRT